MSSIQLVDFGIILIIIISTLFSIKRGFVKEALSLITLIAAIIVARFFGPYLSTVLIDFIDSASVRNVTAYVSLFFFTLIVGGLINKFIAEVVRMAGLTGTDRFLGMVFGCARGVLITVVIVAVLARLGLSEDLWWKESLLIPRFVDLGDWLQMINWSRATQLG